MLATVPNDILWNRVARRYGASPISDTAGYERTLARTSAQLSSDGSDGIEALRALAALMVFVVNVLPFVDMARAMDNALAFPVFGVGVDLFFAISDYLTARSATRYLPLHHSWLRAWAAFMKARLIRIEPLLAAVLVSAMSLWLSGNPAAEPTELAAALSIFSNLLDLAGAGGAAACGQPRGLGPPWPLATEMQCIGHHGFGLWLFNSRCSQHDPGGLRLQQFCQRCHQTRLLPTGFLNLPPFHITNQIGRLRFDAE